MSGLILFGVILVIIVGLAVAVWRPWSGAPGQPAGPSAAPALSPESYAQLVSAFSVGVASLDVEENERAREQFTQATGLAAAEPAAWANLGLAEVRLGNMDAAAAALDKARSLAPDNSRIVALAGLTESRRGQFDRAVELLRRATELDPQNLRAQMALVRELERQNTPQSEQQMVEILQRAHQARPDNLAVVLELLRIAAKRQDMALLKGLVAEIEPATSGWPQAVQQRFGTLRQAAQTPAGDPNVAAAAKTAGREIAFLRNLLVNEPDFRDDLAELETPVSQIGEPIGRFLVLPPPSPTPSPRDQELSFQTQELGPQPASLVRAIWFSGQGDPAIVAGRGGQLVGVRGSTLAVPLSEAPGGPMSVAGVVAADLDYDFLTDVVVAGPGGLKVYWQNAEGGGVSESAQTFADASIAAGSYVAAWACEIDLDGDLDLVLAPVHGPPVVLRNLGNRTFERAPLLQDVPSVRDFAWADIDGDGDPDAAVLDEEGSLHVLANERSGRFVSRAVPGSVGRLAAITAADVDQDAAMDLVGLGVDGRIASLADRSEQDWQVATLANWQGATDALKPGAVVLRAAELDNNGSIDLLASAGGATQVWLGEAKGTLHALPVAIPASVTDVAELTGDGRMDLLGLDAKGVPVLLVNAGRKNYHWQAMRARATQTTGDQRINSFGVGAEVEVRAGLLVQQQIIDHGPAHFGLGEHARADLTRILWPNGVPQVEFTYDPDQLLVAEQRLKGSCPFLFAYNGRDVQFVTDILWRSPLGLRINTVDAASIAQTEDWVRVRGDQLVPTPAGTYDLRITADLWETHYFDHVALMAVDHPTGTEVWVDERFARQAPELKVTLTGPLHPVAKAADQTGRDVGELVGSRDFRYLGGFNTSKYQGIAQDHWVQVELGPEVPADRPLVLIGQGWIQPTDSSINVAIAQGSHQPPPSGIVIEVPDADGNWVARSPDLGFPAGKLKTVVLPLDGLWPEGGARKLRLRATAMVYWDQLAVAEVLEQDGTLRIQRLPPQQADLRYRGISRIERADADSPEIPSYSELETTRQKWNDLVGFYTRFGDVRELLGSVDDRMVILNAGDEVRLQFAAPAPPADGWTRDFVFISDGWEKDGDYNTAFSKTVLPLPRHDWPAYDQIWALEQDPGFTRNPDDWVNYHTRFVTPMRFRQGLGHSE
jgi:tetratricopeptide (TPR) repeat protein